jgi:hypothetical protein
VGFVVDKVALGRVFSEYFGFPYQSSFHQILHHHNHPGQATVGQSVAAMPSGPSWAQSPTMRIKKEIRDLERGDCNLSTGLKYFRFINVSGSLSILFVTSQYTITQLKS